LRSFPDQLLDVVAGLDNISLSYTYRPGGWNIQQLVHHLADSHMHSYLRFKHAILEDVPSIKDYKEADWAMLEDASHEEISCSIDLLTALHKRWTFFLNSCSEAQLSRAYFHPERDKHYPLHSTILLYAWHGVHHIAHIENAKKKGY